MSTNDQDWARPKFGAENSMHNSYMDFRNLIKSTVTAVSQEAEVKNYSLGSNPGKPMWHYYVGHGYLNHWIKCPYLHNCNH